MKIIYLMLIFLLLISCSNRKIHQSNANPPLPKIFEGDFIYLTDSSVFIDYDTSSNFQIAMEGEYFNLENEFLNFNFEEPTKIYLKVEGYLEDREGSEKNNMETFLIVTKIIGFDTNRTMSLL